MCNGRGVSFHGHEHADARGLAGVLPGVQLAGGFVGGEMGPKFGPRNAHSTSAASVMMLDQHRLPAIGDMDEHTFSSAVAMIGS